MSKMPATETKATTPFKTMDIKTAFLSCKSRKRKAPSPPASKLEEKSVRLSLETSSNNDIQILEEVCGKTIILDKRALDTSPNDCKENKDINTTNETTETNSESAKEINNKILIDANKDALPLPTLPSPKPIKNDSEQDMEVSELEKSKISDAESCNELNSSALNSSFNKNLNTSITGEDVEEVTTDSKKTDVAGNKDKESNTKTEVKEKVKKKKMTPAEAQKRAEEREEKKRLLLLKKQEIENKKKERQLEKERRAKEKQVKKEREELERQERERLKQEKKEQEEKEKQLKLQLKMEEKRKKEEAKEEARLKREEELKKADEEKLRKEQKEREKAERTKAAFAKFFVRGNNATTTPAAQAPEKEGVFLPFQVSDDMILAPVVPAAAQERFDKKQLDHYLECQDGEELYLQIMKSGSYKDVRQRKRNKRLSTNEPDVIIIDKSAQAELSLTRKLLMFHENIRPPYWGTWRKKSKFITGRRPFGQDEIFDYDVDSEEEWEEGQGESLSGTEPEDEDEPEDDYEVDNEFFVPHGYLSDEEEKMEEEDDEEETDDLDKHKARLKMKLQEFEKERKKKTTELKPIILGCFFTNDKNFKDSGLQKFLQEYAVEVLVEHPIPTRFTVKDLQSSAALNNGESPNSAEGSATKKAKVLLRKSFPEEAFPTLIRLVHGYMRNKRALADEFLKVWSEQCPISSEIKTEEVIQIMETDDNKDVMTATSIKSSQISIALLSRTIREIATYGKPPDPLLTRPCWWVQEAIREKYGVVNTDFPNEKDYVSAKVIPVKEEKVVPAVKKPSIKEFLAQHVN